VPYLEYRYDTVAPQPDWAIIAQSRQAELEGKNKKKGKLAPLAFVQNRSNIFFFSFFFFFFYFPSLFLLSFFPFLIPFFRSAPACEGEMPKGGRRRRRRRKKWPFLGAGR